MLKIDPDDAANLATAGLSAEDLLPEDAATACSEVLDVDGQARPCRLDAHRKPRYHVMLHNGHWHPWQTTR